MRYITKEQIESIGITPLTCVQWVKEAFMIKNDCVLPPKISIHPQGSDFINTMPCLLPEKYHRFGCKVVSRIKGRQPAVKSDMMLINSLSGEVIAILDADWITAMRTGAVAALAINTFRNSKAKIYSFVGLGVIGHSTIDCFLAINRGMNFTIRLKKYKYHAEKIIERYKNYHNVTFEIADTMDELVDNADVIVSCITEADGILIKDANMFKLGALIIPVHTRGFQNCDILFDKVFADDENHVKGFKYFNEFRKFGEIGDVLLGKIPGRENDTERILSYNIGLGLHDVFYADKIVNMIDNQSITPPNKYLNRHFSYCYAWSAA